MVAAGIELVTHRNRTGELTRERAGPLKLDSVKLFFATPCLPPLIHNALHLRSRQN
jgi:hypothetical protein